MLWSDFPVATVKVASPMEKWDSSNEALALTPAREMAAWSREWREVNSSPLVPVSTGKSLSLLYFSFNWK